MPDDLTTRGIIPGISGYISAPCTYTVNYLNGSRTYTEKFAVINIGSQYTGAASKEMDVIIDDAADALASAAGSVTGGLGLALGPLADIALHWIKDQIFNPDGSVTLTLAYHNIGTKNFGIDPTFWPGGLDPNFWCGIVNSVSSALSMLGAKHNNAANSDFNPVQTTNGKYSEARRESGLSILKKFYSEDNRLAEMYTKGHFTLSKADFTKLGIPIIGEDEKFQIYLKRTIDQIKQKTPDREVNTRMISCFACKTIAYSTATAMVFMGGATVAELGVDAAIVTALADALGVSAELALGYINAAIAAIVYGVDAVVVEICNASGCCS